MKRSLLLLALLEIESAAFARSFVVPKSPELPPYVQSGEAKKIAVVVRNTGENIYWQNPAANGSPESIQYIKAADVWARRESVTEAYAFDIDISKGTVTSVDADPTLYVEDLQVSNKQPLFPQNGNTEFNLTLRSLNAVRTPTTFNYTMYLRFYDVKCALKYPPTRGKRSKHASCIVYSLPLVTQKVTLLPAT